MVSAGEGTGACGLMTVCKRVFHDFKFRLPSSRVKALSVTAKLVDDPTMELKKLLDINTWILIF